jgi:PAT family beta-lactamase induction signal transducer AmpG
MAQIQDDPTSAASPGSPAERRGMLGALAVFLDRRTAVMLALGFAAGLPNLLIFDTLSAWLRDSGLSLEVISFFSLATLSYSFKFLWAPLIDRTTVPGLTKWLGHRRSWMLVAQAAITVGLLLVAGSDPKASLGLVAAFAVFTGFSSATQDIVIDAWRIEAADMSRQGAMAAAYQWGYRIAIIVAGAVPLILADRIGWHFSYALMGALMSIGMLAVLLAPREQAHVIRPIPTEGARKAPLLEALEWLLRLAVLVLAALLIGSGLSANASVLAQVVSAVGLPDAAASLKAAWTGKPDSVWLQLASVLAGFVVVVVAAWPIPGARTRPGLYLSHALGDPLADFFGRFGRTAALILALICLYRLSDFVLNIMTPFYLDLGFSKTQVAEARKVFGMAMSMVGVFAGGWSVARLGVMRSMVIGAFALPIANTIFAWLATRGPDFNSLLIAIGIDNVVSGFAGTCLIAYMSSLTSAGFTATQYALFSSLYSLPGKLIASQSGRIVEGVAGSADRDGLFGILKGLFGHMRADAFTDAMSKSHVSPAALGAGYVAFFIYSGLIGVVSMVLAVLVARAQASTRARAS